MNLCECEILNPLSRDGTNQLQRLLNSLDPDYAKVDERSLEDLLLFTKKYAEYVKYYDRTNDEASKENWVSLIGSDITVLISEIAGTNVKEILKKYEQLQLELFKVTSRIKFKALFEFILEIALTIDDWHNRSVEKLRLNDDLKLMIGSSLSSSLKNLISYDKGAVALTPSQPLDLSYDAFSDAWGIDLTLISADTNVYGTGSNKKKILTASDSVKKVFETHYNSLLKLAKAAPVYMKEALDEYPYHKAHIALFLSFLQLFKYSQDHINTLTKSHLDFYYKEVLGLEEKPAVPDQVHLIFQLAKNVDDYLLKKETRVKAGKDDLSVEVFFETDKDLIINKAQIASLKTVFIDRKNDYQVFASPIANSADGLGAEIESEEAKWPTLGESQKSKSDEERTMPHAGIGFAIASPQFFLKEGSRTITLTFTFEETNFDADALGSIIDDDSFSIYLTGKKDWIEPSSVSIKLNKKYKQLIFTIVIGDTQPAVTAYDSEIHKHNLNSSLPVIKAVLKQDSSSYKYLSSLSIGSIKIDLSVENVKSLILQNDSAKLDPNKPFMPFGTSPRLGSSFYIGSEEIFNKKIDLLKLKIEWHGLPDNFSTHYTGYTPSVTNASFSAYAGVLTDKNWEDKGNPHRLFGNNLASDSTIEISLSNILTKRSKEIEAFDELTNELKRGFIRLKLSGSDFRHKDYANLLTTTIVNKGTGTVTIPKEPYTPVVKSLTAKKYESSEMFDPTYEQYFHLYPFGEIETRPVELVSEKDSDENLMIVGTTNFLPTFKIDSSEQEGVLYIGLSDAVSDQNLSLLFKIAESSGDAELEVPEVTWSYLQNNQWIKLEKSDILADATNGLIATGIIEIALPSNIVTDNTLLAPGCFWISASVEKNTAAVCHTIDIQTQAVTATFIDNGNDPDRLREALPAETISKLETRAAEIKSVTQPYASFNGKIKEQSDEFYTRVSERLRHKNRSVNIWDYERLVLEHFPSIYKVKCLNHTNVCSEIAPGSVTVIPISNLRNQNAVDLLKPKTSIGTLTEIKDYLKKINSPFVRLEVKNPSYEEVFTKFKIKFRTGYDKGYYSNQLNEEIIKYLSPWAFEEGIDIVFGGMIRSSDIINFIEEQTYVDYLTDFELYQTIDGVSSPKSLTEASASKSSSILVSAEAHEISIID